MNMILADNLEKRVLIENKKKLENNETIEENNSMIQHSFDDNDSDIDEDVSPKYNISAKKRKDSFEIQNKRYNDFLEKKT